MPEENIDKEKTDDVTNNTPSGDTGSGKGEEVTIESLQKTIEALKDENTSNIAAMKQFVEENYGRTNSDVQNLMSLIGSLADGGQNNDSSDLDLDYTDPKSIESLVDKKVEAREKQKAEADKKANEAYMDDYVDTVKEVLDNDIAPDGKPLTIEARNGIMTLLKKTFTETYSKSGTKDAIKNIAKAKNRYFGTDKTHGFKGGDAIGTGVGGGNKASNSGSQKTTVTLTEETKKLLSDIGESEDWAKQKLAEKM